MSLQKLIPLLVILYICGSVQSNSCGSCLSSCSSCQNQQSSGTSSCQNQQSSGTCSCQQSCPDSNICYSPQCNGANFTVTPYTVQQFASSSLYFVSSVCATPQTQTWNGVCKTFFKLTNTLHLECFTTTYLDGTYETFVILLSDECGRQGHYINAANTQYGERSVYYQSLVGIKKVSCYNFYYLYTFPSLDKCVNVNGDTNFILDLVNTYPTKIPQCVRSQGASNLCDSLGSCQGSGIYYPPYNNQVYCVTYYNNYPCINYQNACPAKQLSWPPSS